jgi:hypothetical protein
VLPKCLSDELSKFIVNLSVLIMFDKFQIKVSALRVPDASATLSGIKHDWYVCMYVFSNKEEFVFRLAISWSTDIKDIMPHYAPDNIFQSRQVIQKIKTIKM